MSPDASDPEPGSCPSSAEPESNSTSPELGEVLRRLGVMFSVDPKDDLNSGVVRELEEQKRIGGGANGGGKRDDGTAETERLLEDEGGAIRRWRRATGLSGGRPMVDGTRG